MMRERLRVGTRLVVIRDSESLGLDEGRRCIVLWRDDTKMDVSVPILDMTIAGIAVSHNDLAVDE